MDQLDFVKLSTSDFFTKCDGFLIVQQIIIKLIVGAYYNGPKFSFQPERGKGDYFYSKGNF